MKHRPGHKTGTWDTDTDISMKHGHEHGTNTDMDMDMDMLKYYTNLNQLPDPINS